VSGLFDLTGKVAIITGSSRGIGKAIAEAMAVQGAKVTGNGTGTVVVTGSAAAINAALNGLSYTPTADYNGSATLSVSTTDGTATDVDSIAVTVSAVADINNDSASTNEDTAVTVDVLANDTFENAGRAITAVNGSAITAGGPAVAVSNGTVSLNAAGQLTFTPAANYNGTTSFTYTVTSGGVNETATATITVAAINDLPVNTVPAAQVSPEDTALVFSAANGNAITVADVDGGSLTTTVAVTNGTFTLGSTAGVTVSGNGTGTVTITGTGTGRIVTLGNLSGIGTLGISLAAGTATDAAGNTAPAAGPSATFSIVEGWADNFVQPEFNGQIRAIAETSEAYFYGGDFTAVGSVAVNYIARVDKATGAVSPLGSAQQKRHQLNRHRPGGARRRALRRRRFHDRQFGHAEQGVGQSRGQVEPEHEHLVAPR